MPGMTIFFNVGNDDNGAAADNIGDDGILI